VHVLRDAFLHARTDMMILKTEPGASCAWMALLKSGLGIG